MMRKKQIFVFVLSVVFVLIMLVSVYMMFTVNKVNVRFFVYTDSDETVELQEEFNKFTGKNLLFFDTDSVYKKVDVGPRYEIQSVKKSFPDTIEVEVRERRERFVVSFGNENYVVSDEGYVLGVAEGNDNLITINLSGITVDQPVLGLKLSCDHDDDLFNAFALTNVDGVVDAVKEMTVEYVGKTLRSVIFLTATDVRIRIPMATEYGIQKTETAFKVFFNEVRDYIKSYSEIRVDIQPDGTLRTVWVQQ